MLVHEFLINSAALRPDKAALVCGQQRLAYKELDILSDRLAVTLVEMGITRQDRVIIFLENSLESVIAMFAILKAGGVFIMLNPDMKANKLSFILKDSEAKGLIGHTGKFAVINDAMMDTNTLENIIWCEDGDTDLHLMERSTRPDMETILWSGIMNNHGSVPTDKLPRCIDVDLATIIYTSGSTGEPKGVVSTHYNMVAAAASITSYLKNREDDIILNTLPLSFDYGLYQVVMAALFGGTVVLEKSFTYPYAVIERLVQEKVTGFPIVPTMVAILLQLESLGKYDFSSLRYMTNTAAALPVSYIEKLQAFFPHVTIFSMYGLTECKRVAYLPPEELKRKPSSVGIAIPNEEVFIVGADGNRVGPKEVGELVVRGSNVMQGYWKRPEETAKTFKPGRYRGETLLYTGDLFTMDEEGFLYFVARKDDLIKTRGERVSPKEIENCLCSLPGIVEAAVIGVPDEILGQAIKAFLVTGKEARLTQDDVLKHCSKNLESFMVPKYLEFHEILPKSASGKIDKKKLKTMTESKEDIPDPLQAQQ
ncbi:acyl-CoA synthetase, AMP-forming [Geotalea daltonii FRC-32]|uniref:Acyl-CoA synthetase, AMP-forming n=1 Tax=Geotalea daltonii (strain DSM 22248 / JCM 15807 / FRC-32) TaxID=316067 RepID=B9M2U8_GEODF|nr:AMP-binding protein [Geotalea daltonii]ACM21294.1 acyl-CoA synthetase, AMP-forming [Geotalea daltonii FRC-32]